MNRKRSRPPVAVGDYEPVAARTRSKTHPNVQHPVDQTYPTPLFSIFQPPNAGSSENPIGPPEVRFNGVVYRDANARPQVIEFDRFDAVATAAPNVNFANLAAQIHEQAGRILRINEQAMALLQTPGTIQLSGFVNLFDLTDRVFQTKPPGLSKDEIASIPCKRFGSSASGSQANCVICMNNFTLGQLMRVLPCNHQFHRACVDTWFKNKVSCPLCRHSLVKLDVGTIPSSAASNSTANGPH